MDVFVPSFVSIQEELSGGEVVGGCRFKKEVLEVVAYSINMGVSLENPFTARHY